MKKIFIFTFFIFLFLNFQTVFAQDPPAFDPIDFDFGADPDGSLLPELEPGEGGYTEEDLAPGFDIPVLNETDTGSPQSTGAPADSNTGGSNFIEDVRDSSVNQQGNWNYIPLTDIGTVANNLFGSGALRGQTGLGILVNQIFFVVLAIAVVLAVFSIIRGGYLYVTSADNAFKKQEAKNKIWSAFGGLLLAFGTVLILGTINTGITNFDFAIGPINTVDPYIQYQDTVRKSADKDKFLEDGLGASDAFFAGENDGWANQILSMSDSELVEYLNNQLSRDGGETDYRDFIIKLMERRDYYQNGNSSNRPSIRKEIERMNNLLTKFGSIDQGSGLTANGVFASASQLHGARKIIGVTNQLGITGIPNANHQIINQSNLGTHAILFVNDDTDSIMILYETSGGNVENNLYSQSVVEALNNSEFNLEPIETWVDQNGSSIGITKDGDTYTLAN